MVKKITWKCCECGHQDVYPGADDVSLEWLTSADVVTNTMCTICGAPCAPIKVEEIDSGQSAAQPGKSDGT